MQFENGDVVDRVNEIMDWAFGLGYSNHKNVDIAVQALTKLKLIDIPEARYAAVMYLDLRGLHDLGDLYMPLA